MSRIDEIFADQRQAGRTGLIPFVTGGHPTLEATEAVIPALEKVLGPAVLEIGFPFSDPIADGPVIAASMHDALQAGVTPADLFDLVRRLRPRTEMGLVAMVSVSIVERMDRETFVAAAAEAGFDGLIIPDLDAGDNVAEHARRSGLSFTMLVAPTTGEDRLATLVKSCTGFVYLLARVGITGERDAVPDMSTRVGAVRGLTDLPVAVGFGISGPRDVASVTSVADAAVVGSAIVRRMGEAGDPAGAAAAFVDELAGALSAR